MRLTGIFITVTAGIIAASCGNTKKVVSTPGPLQQEVMSQRADSLFFAAQRSKILGDYKTAITQYSDYIRLNRNNPTVYYELSPPFLEVRNPQYALGFARRAAAMDTSNKWFQMALADAFSVNEMFDSAAVVYGRLSKQNPLDDELLFNKGISLSKAENYTEALEVFDSLEARVGVAEEIVFQKQRVYSRLGMVDGAASVGPRRMAQEPTSLLDTQ